MVRGNCLIDDLKILINNPQYSDLEIKCKDGVILHGNRAILAARSEVFNRLLFTRTSETPDKQVSFLKIEASTMKIILEYLYTGSVIDGSLSTDNAFETLHAADFFQLNNLQDTVSEFCKQACNEEGNYNKSPELLSKAVQLMSSSSDNGIVKFLVDSVAKIPLDTIGFNQLSLQALQCLLSKSNDEKVFATDEYSVLRFAILLAAKKVSQEAFLTLEKRLPIWDRVRDKFDFNNNNLPENIMDICASTANNVEPLIEFIDLRRINGKILADIIEPLNLISPKKMIAVYRSYAYDKNPSSTFRGKLFTIGDAKWDSDGCGPNLIISPDGYTVSHDESQVWNSVRTNNLMTSGIHELRIEIKSTFNGYVGICGEENDYSNFLGYNSNSWMISSAGCYYYNDSKTMPLSTTAFNDVGTEVTMHLNMNNKIFSISVNGKKFIMEWKNLPSKLYFAASLYYSNIQLRIISH